MYRWRRVFNQGRANRNGCRVNMVASYSTLPKYYCKSHRGDALEVMQVDQPTRRLERLPARVEGAAASTGAVWRGYRRDHPRGIGREQCEDGLSKIPPGVVPGES